MNHEQRYQPIESYGVIGNMRTCAHVCKDNGSIDWFCYPQFNSPSIFARILDHDKGGFFKICDADTAGEVQQKYWPDTNILITKFARDDASGQVIDFMPALSSSHLPNDPDISKEAKDIMKKREEKIIEETGAASLLNIIPNIMKEEPIQDTDAYRWIIRRIEVTFGEMSFTMTCKPAFNYARDQHELYLIEKDKKAVFMTDDLCMTLESSCAQLQACDNGVTCTFIMTEVASTTFIFRESSQEEIDLACSSKQVTQDKNSSVQKIDKNEHNQISTKTDWLFILTLQFWHDWLKKCTYQGRWREYVYRSALILKLCQFEPTGAIVAAPTTSLPENIGGTRNWDYRFTWLRDAAFVVYALIRVGLHTEAECFIKFLEKKCRDSIDPNLLNEELMDGTKVQETPPLKPLYPIDGNNELLKEEILDHLEGYKQSKPVRIGNAASNQLQLDIYGELLDSIYLYNKYCKPISYDFWTYIVYIVNWVCNYCKLPDEGKLFGRM
jgi:GH15 family glucan-1,4-alpha-glucosidase